MNEYKPRLNELSETCLPSAIHTVTLRNLHSWLPEQLSGEEGCSSPFNEQTRSKTMVFVVQNFLKEARDVVVTSTEPGMVTSGMLSVVCRAIVANCRAYQRAHYGSGVKVETVIYESISFNLTEDKSNVDCLTAIYRRAQHIVTKMLQRLSVNRGRVYEVSLRINDSDVLSRSAKCVKDIAYSGTVLSIDGGLVVPNADDVIELLVYASGKNKQCIEDCVSTLEKYKNSKWFQRFFERHVDPMGSVTWNGALYVLMRLCTDDSAPLWKALYNIGMFSSLFIEEDMHDLVSLLSPRRQASSEASGAAAGTAAAATGEVYYHNVHMFAREIEKFKASVERKLEEDKKKAAEAATASTLAAAASLAAKSKSSSTKSGCSGIKVYK